MPRGGIQLKPILAKQPHIDGAWAELEKGVRETAEEGRTLFALTTMSWSFKNKPIFIVEVQTAASGRSIRALISTDHEIYGYVSKGTRPHKIRPKKPGGKLAFRTGYVPKTIPGVIVTRGGGTATGDQVFANEVNHPGNEPRNFPKLVARELHPVFKRNMEAALKRFAQALHR